MYVMLCYVMLQLLHRTPSKFDVSARKPKHETISPWGGSRGRVQGVEIEQETSAPPPKINPGSAPVTQRPQTAQNCE